MLSTKPYLLRAIYEWCVDQGYTPYLAVVVDRDTQVPQPYVKDGQIVLNISPEAAHQLVIGNETITCSARFGGVAQALSVPVDAVAAIYAKENGHGMAFEIADRGQHVTAEADTIDQPPSSTAENPPPDKPAGPKPHLTRVK